MKDREDKATILEEDREDRVTTQGKEGREDRGTTLDREDKVDKASTQDKEDRGTTRGWRAP